jgi:hypothetical protein
MKEIDLQRQKALKTGAVVAGMRRPRAYDP